MNQLSAWTAGPTGRHSCMGSGTQSADELNGCCRNLSTVENVRTPINTRKKDIHFQFLEAGHLYQLESTRNMQSL